MIDIDKIAQLIFNKEENDICDFKERWPKELEGIIKDIISFSNRVDDDDSYIIIGVRDSDKQIVGVENKDNKRFKQAELTEFLRKVPFAEARPKIKVDTITIDSHELDVITICNSKYTPFYLTKKFNGLQSCYIYTRVNDCNSPDDESIEPLLIQKLWMKRFNLLNRQNPKELFFLYLKNYSKWNKGVIDYEKDETNSYYYIENPLFNIHIKSIDCDYKRKFTGFSVNQFDPKVSYEYLDCYYGTTVLQRFLLINLDGARFTDVYPNEYVFKSSNNEIFVFYFVADDEDWLLRSFVTKLYQTVDLSNYEGRDRYLETIICFNTNDEKDEFFKFLKCTYSDKEIKPLDIEIAGGIGVDLKDKTEINDLKYRLRFTLAVKQIYNKWINDYVSTRCSNE